MISGPEAARGETRPKFDLVLSGILHRQISPVNIDSYADAALEATVALVEAVVDDYSFRPTILFESSKDTEQAAFNYHRLGLIEPILDHIASKAAELRDIDSMLESVDLADAIIVPPDDLRAPVEGSDKRFKSKQTVPRLKTTIFLLSNEFGIDIHDDAEFRLQKGRVTSSMVRQQPYWSIEVRSLGKNILICDEEENATFAFDSHGLEERDVTTDRLLEMSKQELKALIDEDESLGKWIMYSKNFAAIMIHELRGDDSLEASGRYLIAPAPPDIRSIGGIASLIGATFYTVARAIEAAGDKIGDVSEYRFGPQTARGYNEDQQLQILEILETNNFFVPPAPEDVKSANGLRHQYAISHMLLDKIVAELKEELGELKVYAFGPKRAFGFDTEQRRAIDNYIRENKLQGIAPPSNYLSIRGIALLFNVSHKTAASASRRLGEAIGETDTYRFGAKDVPGYSPHQQNLIFDLLPAWTTTRRKDNQNNDRPA